MFLFVVAVSVALTISALCSLMEAALLSFSSTQLAELEQRRPASARIWQRFKTNIEKPIAVILILNTTAHTVGASVAGAEFERLWGTEWLIAFSLLLTYLMLQFTEILPKTLGVKYSGFVARVIAHPLDALIRALSPVLWFIHLINKPFEGRKSGGPRTLEEITALASMAKTAKVLDAQQANLILGASRLPDIRVRQAMTPRPEVAFLRVSDSFAQTLETLRSTGFSRFPLVEGTEEHVIGMIHARDVLNLFTLDGAPPTKSFDLRRLKHEIPFLPGTATLPQVLRLFQQSRVHMAVVLDEYGSTEGIVTLEDVLEELVGEIDDEFDLPLQPVEAQGSRVRVKASLGLHELADLLQADLADPDVTTLGGLVMKELGRFPEVGDTVRIGDFEAVVLSMDKQKIDEIELTSVPEDEARLRANE